MKISLTCSRPVALGFATPQPLPGSSRQSGFTLVEVLLSMALMLILIISGMRGIMTLNMMSNRLGDYTAATAVVEAKMQGIRQATYNPNQAPFNSATMYFTNSHSIALNQIGTTLLVPGTIVSKFEPVSTGHLITVTGTFKGPGQPIVVVLQSVVNEFSGGQQ